MITAAVKAALGENVTDIEQKPYDGHWAEVILHADKSGTFQGLEITRELELYVVEKDLWVKTGDKISSFNGANDAIGTLVMKFCAQDKTEGILGKIGSNIKLRINQ